jgi:hypothetical protein
MEYLKTRCSFLILVCMALAACAASSHEMSGHQVQEKDLAAIFSFSSRAVDFKHDADDPKAEAARIGILEQHLRTNQMCPKGYALTSRRVIVQIGEKDEIDYVGRCTG